jgi:hypothetical protein
VLRNPGQARDIKIWAIIEGGQCTGRDQEKGSK